MVEAVGFSHLYPAVPVMNFLSMALLLLLIPGFWKTRMVALVSLVCWLVLGNLMSFIGMIQWRGNTNDVPIWADILATLWRIWFLGCFMSMACFAHFTWQRLQPLPIRQLYDTRRRNNLIHLFLTLLLPLFWAPLFIFSCKYRYIILEDFGPSPSMRWDWPAFVVNQLPLLVCLLTIGIFNFLAVLNYWRMKRKVVESDPLKHHYSVQTRKLIILAHLHILYVVYGVYRQVSNLLNQTWVARESLAENIASLQLVLGIPSSRLKSEIPNFLKFVTVTRIIIPLLGFHLFAWFGFEAEIRKAYREALSKFGRLISTVFREHRPHIGSVLFACSSMAPRKVEPQGGSTCTLALMDLNVPQITPYISTVARDDDPGSHEGIPPSNSIENWIDVKRWASKRTSEPTRWLSTHRPAFPHLNPANAAKTTTNSVPIRRISHHKPSLPPVNPTASVPEASRSTSPRIDKASNTERLETSMAASLRAPRLSYHNPPFVPLGLPNTSAMATPQASGSIPPRTEDVDNARRRAKFAPRALPRRLSYHKPAFVPLAFASDTSAVANELGTNVPLGEMSGNSLSNEGAGSQAEGPVGNDSSTSLPQFSTLFPEHPPPTYRELNPSLDHVS